MNKIGEHYFLESSEKIDKNWKSISHTWLCDKYNVFITQSKRIWKDWNLAFDYTSLRSNVCNFGFLKISGSQSKNSSHNGSYSLKCHHCEKDRQLWSFFCIYPSSFTVFKKINQATFITTFFNIQPFYRGTITRAFISLGNFEIFRWKNKT